MSAPPAGLQLYLISFYVLTWTSGSSRFTYCWSLAWRILSITLLACEMSAWRIPGTGSLVGCRLWVAQSRTRLKQLSSRDECNCVVVWAFFGIAFLWDWNENWPFPVLWPLLSFPNLLLLAFFKCWMKLKYQFQSSCVLPSSKQHWIVISGDYKTEGCWNRKFDLGSGFPGLCRNFILYNENWNIRIMSMPTHKILSLGIHWEINRRIKHFKKYFGSLHTPSAWGKYLHLNVFWV